MISKTRAAKAERDAMIRDMYARNVPARQIARTVGVTYGSLKVIASRLGCTKQGQAYLDYRRGFAVPDDKQAEYDVLQSKGLSAAEIRDVLEIEPLYKEQTT